MWPLNTLKFHWVWVDKITIGSPYYPLQPSASRRSWGACTHAVPFLAASAGAGRKSRRFSSATFMSTSRAK